jgi:hypothetical protein
VVECPSPPGCCVGLNGASGGERSRSLRVCRRWRSGRIRYAGAATGARLTTCTQTRSHHSRHHDMCGKRWGGLDRWRVWRDFGFGGWLCLLDLPSYLHILETFERGFCTLQTFDTLPVQNFFRSFVMKLQISQREFCELSQPSKPSTSSFFSSKGAETLESRDALQRLEGLEGLEG